MQSAKGLSSLLPRLVSLLTSLLVKCDRNDPCGNCLDGDIPCKRTQSAARPARSASKRRRGVEFMSAQKSSRHHELQTSLASPTPSPSMPQSPSILEAQEFIRREIRTGKNMPADRLSVLKDAMSFVDHISQVTKSWDASSAPSTRVLDVLQDISYPSIEVLYWMVRGKCVISSKIPSR
jgi:hypothetical protein